MTDLTTLDPLALTPELEVGVNVDKSGRARRHIRFSLDLTKGVEAWLYDQIKGMIAERMFQPIARDALRLWLDLHKRRTDVLKKLFPWVVEAITNERVSELAGKVEELEKTIAQLRASGIRTNGNGHHAERVTVETNYEMPDLEIKQAAVDGKISVQNFLNAMFRLNPEAAPKAVSAGTGNPKAMDVPQFDTPNFDDIDIEL